MRPRQTLSCRIYICYLCNLLAFYNVQFNGTQSNEGHFFTSITQRGIETEIFLISVTSVPTKLLLQGEVSYHQKRLRGDLFFDFGRIPQWNCPIAGKPAPQKRKKQKKNRRPPTPAPAPASDKPWFIPPIECYEPEDGVFFAQVEARAIKNRMSFLSLVLYGIRVASMHGKTPLCHKDNDWIYLLCQLSEPAAPILTLLIFRSDQQAETMATQQSLGTLAGASPGTLTASSSPRSTW